MQTHAGQASAAQSQRNGRSVTMMRALIAVMVALVATVGVLATPQRAHAAYPYKDQKMYNSDKSIIGDKWGFGVRQGTSFVAWRLNTKNKVAFKNVGFPTAGTYWGDAKRWKKVAKDAGFTVDKKPAAGAVAYKGDFVAWVLKVSGGNVITQAYSGGKYKKFNFPKSYWDCYIHIKDLKGGNGGSTSGKLRVVSSSQKASDIAKKYATVGFTVRNPRKLNVTQCGVQIRKLGDIDWTTTNKTYESRLKEKKSSVELEVGNNSEVDFALSPGTTYQWRGFVRYNDKRYYGASKTFTTLVGKIGKGKKVVSDGTYYVKSTVGKAMALDIAGSSASGANVQILDQRGDEMATVWKIERGADGFYVISDTDSATSLDVYRGKKVSGTNVRVWTTKSGYKRQQWVIEEDDDGMYRIRARKSGLYLNVVGGKKASGTNVDIESNTDPDSCEWRLKKIAS